MTDSAIIAALSLFLVYTVTIVGATAWLDKRLREIKNDFDTKHQENQKSVGALREIVIRHDVMLNPEFGFYRQTPPQQN